MTSSKNKKKHTNKSKSTKGQQMIPLESDVKCPWCMGESKLKEWSDLTYEQCTSREMKREFHSLSEPVAWIENPGYFFKCPICNNWSGGFNLSIVNTEDEKLKRLGGKPVIINYSSRME